MRVLEKVLVVLVIAGMIMRLFDIPSHSLFFVFPALGLACLYFLLGPLLFNGIRLRDIVKKMAYQNTKGKEMILAAILGLFLSIVVTGVIFKWMSWPNGNKMILIGGVSTSVLMILILVLSNNTFKKSALFRVIPLLLISGILFSFSTYQVSKWVMRDHPEIVQTLEKIENDPWDSELRLKLRELELKLRFEDEQVEELMKMERQYQKETNGN